ncbi:hypothetical protein DPMN_079464 [Dreissena polymorpha]|uniref:PDEase domain-containing protein n=1 Tax=Dreissena polymorpha TaxID=45954 RepID=A0A9D3YS92_DREPO|nr:hypothetical protein DPMN_079464 [Dreissena polymorpha]
MVLAGIRIFTDLGLMKTCRIEYDTLCRFLLTVRKNYRNVAYHNWRHAFNVCQLMFATMQAFASMQAIVLEAFATIQAFPTIRVLELCMSNNASISNYATTFQNQLSSCTTLRHPCDTGASSLQPCDHDIEQRDEGRIDWDDKGLKEIFRSILMTTCDIGAITKPWEKSKTNDGDEENGGDDEDTDDNE